MRLSEFKGEEALEVLADIIEPCSVILADPEVKSGFESGKKLKLVSLIMRKYKREILNIMAILDKADPQTYAPNLVEIPKKIIELLNDPDVINLFTLQAQSNESTNSGSASENIKD